MPNDKAVPQQQPAATQGGGDSHAIKHGSYAGIPSSGPSQEGAGGSAATQQRDRGVTESTPSFYLGGEGSTPSGRAAFPEASKAEPVAWMVEDAVQGRFFFSSEGLARSVAGSYAASEATVTPVYAHPPAEDAARALLREALRYVATNPDLHQPGGDELRERIEAYLSASRRGDG